jgi:hypothetical protein
MTTGTYVSGKSCVDSTLQYNARKEKTGAFSRAGARPVSDYEIQAIAVGTRLELEK